MPDLWGTKLTEHFSELEIDVHTSREKVPPCEVSEVVNRTKPMGIFDELTSAVHTVVRPTLIGSGWQDTEVLVESFEPEVWVVVIVEVIVVVPVEVLVLREVVLVVTGLVVVVLD
jgi:hypothetical protein